MSLYFFFLKQRNVSLKGSLLPSGTLASGHPLRSLECAREGQSPLPLWPGPCGPTLLVSAATTPTGPWGPQLGALPLKEGRHGSAGHLSPQGWQDRIPGLRPGNLASGKPPPRVSLHDPSSHRGCEPVGLRLSFSTLKTVTILKVAAAANTPIKLATGQALCFVPGVRYNSLHSHNPEHPILWLRRPRHRGQSSVRLRRQDASPAAWL